MTTPTPQEKGQAMTSPDEIERPNLEFYKGIGPGPTARVACYALAQEARISALEAKLEEAEGRRQRALIEVKSLQIHAYDVLSEHDTRVISTRLHNIRTALKGDDNE